VIHLAIVLSVFIKPRIEERQKIQWANEPQAMNRRKTDNTMAK
jgi:hypothetical protein